MDQHLFTDSADEPGFFKRGVDYLFDPETPTSIGAEREKLFEDHETDTR